MTPPSFAVVGHPNKGKSSLVSTLARDASVGVGTRPGTTREAREFPMRLDGETQYVLIDTPGFQRPRAALEWMRARENGAASRPKVVEAFVKANRGTDRFEDECRLLEPLVAGSGIIYVVDGAVPYGPEYDAEMEILRWTGCPSMAVINPIGSADFVDEWTDALGQFFRVVRVLDVLQAPFEQQIEMLRAFGQLREDWRDPLERAVEALIEERKRQHADAAELIAHMVAEALHLQETLDISKTADPKAHEPELAERYRKNLRRLERRAREEVESIYGHQGIDRSEPEFAMLETDLLSRESWLAFGLSRNDLMTVGAISGAVVGGTVDVAVLGASFFTGSLVGGMVGGALGYFSSVKLADLKVLKRSLGGVRLRYGPSRDLQLPFVLLRRARLHHAVVAGRTHAQRGRLAVEDTGVELPDEPAKRELARVFATLRKAEPGTRKYVEAVRCLAELDAGS